MVRNVERKSWKTKKDREKRSLNQVPRTRVELARESSHYPLKVACLPIPPPGLLRLQKYNFFSKERLFSKIFFQKKSGPQGSAL